MIDTSKVWSSVPDSKLTLGQSKDQKVQQTEGAKNLRVRPGNQGRRLIHIATYNVMTFSSEEKLLELEELK